MGVGLGTASVASTQTGTDAADPAYRGVASGVLNSAAQVGTAVGVALLLPLAASIGLDTMSGYRIGWVGAGAIAVAGALAGLLVPAVNAAIPTGSGQGLLTFSKSPPSESCCNGSTPQAQWRLLPRARF
jgi:MFS family permease